MCGIALKAILRHRMSKVAASLAAVLAALAFAGCGEDGAEPDAPREATLVLDFQPNPAHVGIYEALERGLYENRGVDLEVQEPSASTDAPKLLRAGRAEFAILDIHDLGLARQEGYDLVGLVPIVQRPLAAVIAADRDEVRRPRDLEGGRVGVTGLPSDDAVLDSVLEADGADPAAVERVTIGFEAVAALRAGRLDAATGFWNSEGVTLRRAEVPTREFRVDDYGAPRYPELVLVTTGELLDTDPGLASSVADATTRGYEIAVAAPLVALDSLLGATDALDVDAAEAQLEALAPAFEPVGPFDEAALRAWSRWDVEHGILDQPIDVDEAFELGHDSESPAP
jgi:putative hydroxymethylpyrimidine transport system substrate-binding protein